MNNSKKGFTLIELLVTIAIIGVLTAVLLANMVGIRERSSDTKLKNDVNQLKTALRLYYNDNQSYPGAADNTPINCECLDGSCDGVFQSATSVYMRDVPTNADTGCSYRRRNSGEGFYITINLKNQSDPDAGKSASRCGFSETPGLYYQCAD